MCVHGQSWYFRGELYLIPINSKVQYNRLTIISIIMQFVVIYASRI